MITLYGIIPFPALEAQIAPAFNNMSLGYLVGKIIPLILVFAGFLLLLYLLYGGFALITSGGDPKGLQAGKNKVLYALVGFIIIFVAYWLVEIAGMVLGIPSFSGVF
jgi:hypothetical protein